MRNFSSVSTPNQFKAIRYPQLEDITAFDISLLTHTLPLTPPPDFPKTKNPIAILPTSSGISVFWGHKTTISTP